MDILLVEDDQTLGKMVWQGLGESGHHCQWLVRGEQAIAAVRQQRFDVIVLDRMLPDISGMEVLAQLKRGGDETPVLMLTALGSVANRVEGLESGADDYLTKPFDLAELLARLVAVTRRTRRNHSSIIEVGPVRMDLAQRTVARSGKALDLTPTEFEMLELLLREAGQVVTRKMICQHLWDEHWEGVTNVVEVHITRLRAKLDRDFSFPLLHTVRGRGYVLEVRQPPG
ncbi:MAG: response regulator transcription factor [Planctomycetaceae bacterium]